MSEQHTPEPWSWRAHVPRYDVFLIFGLSTSQDCVGDAIWREADARRIVACVNALKGVPTEELERWITEAHQITTHAHFTRLEKTAARAQAAEREVIEYSKRMHHIKDSIRHVLTLPGLPDEALGWLEEALR